MIRRVVPPETVRVETNLSRQLTDQLTVSARWRFIDNDSTAKVFDYDQHLVGVYLTVGIGRQL